SVLGGATVFDDAARCFCRDRAGACGRWNLRSRFLSSGPADTRDRDSDGTWGAAARYSARRPRPGRKDGHGGSYVGVDSIVGTDAVDDVDGFWRDCDGPADVCRGCRHLAGGGGIGVLDSGAAGHARRSDGSPALRIAIAGLLERW